ncbi:Uncharacterized conserved protein YegP, UPF0339 family [Haloplanus vescus]|uniref:Uncharacterized conserved protein YegP, UPF0339 family n=1 Tax=Haloplanus vescus TaxID=555874 RepID=A0A1H3XF50_9EURY|nr:DUF1508 domain-containing protein [Haloplanus vescus]SDZ97963.1 Uncharacterized conserved protein YegP, UPF0339 family [Haloplanus vescus]
MSSNTNQLTAWYREHIGRPTNGGEVTGYWIFVVGVVAGTLGIFLSLGAAPASAGRQMAILLGAGGLVLILAGPIIRLPLRRAATLLTYLGVAISALALVWFLVAFPDNWSRATGNRSIIGLYGFGVLIIAIAGIVVPILTQSADAEADERAAEAAERAERERERAATEERHASELETVRAALANAKADEADLAAELRGLHESQGRFELYEDKGGEYRWRLRHRNGNAIASSGEGYTRRHNAHKGMQSVRRNALGATVVDLDAEADIPAEDDEFEPVEEHESNATVEVYEDQGGEYRWRLVHDNGNLLADSGEGYSTKSNARRALRSVQLTVGPADYLWFDPAGFETYRDKGGEYRWRLVARNGQIIATSGEGFATHGNARRAVRGLRDGLDDFESEVYEDARDEYRWRLRASNGELVAGSGEGYTRQDDAEDALERVNELVPEADTLEIGLAAFEIFEDEAGEHRWRLRHRNGNILADSGEGYTDRSSVRDAIESVKRNAPNAAAE